MNSLKVFLSLVFLFSTVSAVISYPCGYYLDHDAVLSLDITGCNGTVFYINASGITLDCQGNLLETSGSYGIRNEGFDNVVVKNCEINLYDSDAWGGIYYTDVDGGTIENNDVYAGENLGILVTDSDDVDIIGNDVTIGNQDAIRLRHTRNSNVSNNVATGRAYTLSIAQGADDNYISNNHITSTASFEAISLYGHSGSILVDNTAISDDEGLSLYSVSDAQISGGSVSSPDTDYYVRNAGSSNRIRNTGFTDGDKIQFYDSSSWFNYNQEATGGVWLNTKLNESAQISRDLDSLSQEDFSWTDTGNGLTATYELEDLLASTEYSVFENSVFTRTITTDSNGNTPTFSVTLDGTTQIQLTTGSPGDTTPPETTILEGPSGTIDHADVTFNWTGSDDSTPVQDLEYSYSMDSATWSSWSTDTSTSFNDLSEGQYSFEVKARDASNNEDLTPDARTFTISLSDTTPPETTITSGPSGSINYENVTFEWNGTDDQTPSQDIYFQYKLDEATWSQWSHETYTSYESLSEGEHTFYVQAMDDSENQEPTPKTRSFTIILTTNQPPIAADDFYSTQGNLSIPAPGILQNDSDPEENNLTVVLVQGTNHGNLELNPDGSFDYVPEQGFSGQDSFSYTCNDGELDSEVATVSINITSSNLPPEISNPTPENGTTGTDTDLFLEVNISDPEDLLDWSITTIPQTTTCEGSQEVPGLKSCELTELDFFTTYNWRINVFDGNSWTNKTFRFTTKTDSTNDAPSINIVAPENNKKTTDQIPSFEFLVNDNDDETINCELHLDGGISQTQQLNADGETVYSFSPKSSLSLGSHEWLISCSDSNSTENTTKRELTIVQEIPDTVPDTIPDTIPDTSPQETENTSDISNPSNDSLASPPPQEDSNETDAKQSFCGDRIQDEGEECDGNAPPGFWCDGKCKLIKAEDDIMTLDSQVELGGIKVSFILLSISAFIIIILLVLAGLFYYNERKKENAPEEPENQTPPPPPPQDLVIKENTEPMEKPVMPNLDDYGK